jgi:hypothetical protein
VVSVTVYVRLRANLCEVVTPVALVPSPKLQLYDVALLEVLPSKLQVSAEQLFVRRATDAGGGGGGGGGGVLPPMNAV